MEDSCRKLPVAGGRGGRGGEKGGYRTEFWPAGLGLGVHAQYREGCGVEDS